MKPLPATCHQLILFGLLGGLMTACESVRESAAETRPVGEPILSGAQLKEARVAVRFVDHVKPILEERCLHCHSKEAMPGKFSLETREEAMAGGRRIVPGHADQSLLIIALTTGNHAMTMPAVGTAPPPEEIEVLKNWIDAGAQWPAGVRLGPRR